MKPGHEVAARRRRSSRALVLAEAGHDPVDDRDVDVEPLAREDAEDAARPDHEVGRLVAPRNRQPSLEVTRRHARMIAGSARYGPPSNAADAARLERRLSQPRWLTVAVPIGSLLVGVRASPGSCC